MLIGVSVDVVEARPRPARLVKLLVVWKLALDVEEVLRILLALESRMLYV